MFRKRLSFALAGLAAATVLQGMAAIWALGQASDQVLRGRVAGDIQLHFVDLFLTKQLLRTWLTQLQLGVDTDPAERERLQALMRSQLASLQALSQEAIALDGGDAARPDHVQRRDALGVLVPSLQQLDQTLDQARLLSSDANAGAAWQAIDQAFEVSQGRHLRTLLTENVEREAAAVSRERLSADKALSGMRALWAGAAITLAAAALGLAAYFAHRLRRPLDALNEGAQALQRGDLTHRIAEDSDGEFSAVAHSMNSMAAELLQHRQNEARARQQLEELVHARTHELQAAIETLQRLDARRRRLFADISHELRTPTTAIRGEAEIALRGQDKPAEDYKASLRRIVSTSGELALVIDDLLTMARSDIDALSLNRVPIDLRQPLQEAIAQADVLARERQVQLEPLTLPAEQIMISADAPRIRQLIAVLLDNAIRYSHPQGRVSIALECPPAGDEPECYCVITVRDAGIGISAADLPQVFERNFRSEAARRHRADGTGLGLSIGAALARAHGGEIRIESQPGQGCIARLQLPLIIDPQDIPA